MVFIFLKQSGILNFSEQNGILNFSEIKWYFLKQDSILFLKQNGILFF